VFRRDQLPRRLAARQSSDQLEPLSFDELELLLFEELELLLFEELELLLFEELELLLLEELELLLLEELELLLLEELELLLLDELELLLLDELDELLPATTIGFSAVPPVASASMSRPRSGRGECDQPPSLVGICLATAEPPVSSAASAPSDTNILRFMSTAPHRPNQ
jgi:hypothetical protein